MRLHFPQVLECCKAKKRGGVQTKCTHRLVDVLGPDVEAVLFLSLQSRAAEWLLACLVSLLVEGNLI